MSNLEKAKEIVKAYYGVANCGIFNNENIVGDSMSTVYEDEDLTIKVCCRYAYFEVFGLSDADFKELKKYYGSLSESEEEQNLEWIYSIFDKDKIKAHKERLTKEAEERGMTLIEYLESIDPLKEVDE